MTSRALGEKLAKLSGRLTPKDRAVVEFRLVLDVTQTRLDPDQRWLTEDSCGPYGVFIEDHRSSKSDTRSGRDPARRESRKSMNCRWGLRTRDARESQTALRSEPPNPLNCEESSSSGSARAAWVFFLLGGSFCGEEV